MYADDGHCRHHGVAVCMPAQQHVNDLAVRCILQAQASPEHLPAGFPGDDDEPYLLHLVSTAASDRLSHETSLVQSKQPGC